MKSQNFEKVRLEIDGSVAKIILNDPPVMNAVGMPMLGGLKDAFDQIETPASGIRCVVMTGEGKAFCTGANLSDGRVAGGQSNPSSMPPDAGSALETAYHPMFRRIRALKMPFLTAVNGPAAGVGMSFAMMGDLIFAAKSAYFLQAFRRIGLVPDGSSTWLLPRLVGLQRAKELSLLGERLPAEKALDWGLINRVVDDEKLIGEVMTLAQELAAGPTVALSLIRRAYADSFDNSYEQQIHLERMLQQEAGRTEDFREGVSAFLQKRKAEFKGR